MNPDHLATANRLLEHPDVYPGLAARKCPRLVLRVWRYPSFEPHCSWGIVESEREFFLRRVAWDQVRCHEIEPITYGAETPFAAAAYSKLSSKLAEIRAPLFQIDQRVGLDGTRSGVEKYDFAVQSRFCWLEPAPASWTDIEEWHKSAIELFESILPASTAGREVS